MKFPHLLVVALLSVSTGILLLPISAGAEKRDVDATKTQQRQLESLLNEIEQTSQQRQEHDQRIIRLKHQLECNWTLVRAYENCEQQYKNSPDEHLNCSTNAKQNALKCQSQSQSQTE